MLQEERKEELVKEFAKKYAIKGYLTEGKIRGQLAEANNEAEAEKIIQNSYNEACEKREKAYENRVRNFEQAITIQDYENVKETLEALDGYKDCEELIKSCQLKIEELKKQRVKERRENEAIMEQQLSEVYARDKKEFKWLIVGGIAFLIACTILLLWLGEKILLL